MSSSEYQLRNRFEKKKKDDNVATRQRAATASIVMTQAAREAEDNDLDEKFLLLEDGREEEVARRSHAENPAPTMHRTHSEPTSPLRGSSSRNSFPEAKKEKDAWDSVSDAFSSLASSILDILPNSFANSFIKNLTLKELLVLEAFQDRYLHPYDKANEEHVRMLRGLWDACMLAEHRRTGGSALVVEGLTPTLPPPPEDLKAEEWKKYGFQNIDPASDFRGGGAFSLRNLLFLAETYPTSYAAFCTADYPFAIAGINVTMMLLNLLKLTGGKATCLATTQKNENYSAQTARINLSRILASYTDQSDVETAFQEVYCVCVSIVHQHWMASKRNLLEFNSILKASKTQIDTILRNATKLSDITKHGNLEQ